VDAKSGTERWRAKTHGRTTNLLWDKLSTGPRQIWWIDPQTNGKVEFRVSEEKHDVGRKMGMIFGVAGKQLWGASFSLK
jgi:hypothetical protein